LQKRPIISKSLLIVATPFVLFVDVYHSVLHLCVVMTQKIYIYIYLYIYVSDGLSIHTCMCITCVTHTMFVNSTQALGRTYVLIFDSYYSVLDPCVVIIKGISCSERERGRGKARKRAQERASERESKKERARKDAREIERARESERDRTREKEGDLL